MYTSNKEVFVGYLAAVRCCLHKMYTLKMIMNAISIPSRIQMTLPRLRILTGSSWDGRDGYMRWIHETWVENTFSHLFLCNTMTLNVLNNFAGY